MTGSYLRVCVVLSFFLVVLTSVAIAENVKIEGLIVGRSGDEMIVKFGSGAELTFQLTDDTKVTQVGGLFKAQRQQKSMAALIPGLKIQVEGTYNEQRQVIATSVKFNGDDLEQAESAQAAVYQTKMQAQANQEELEKQNAELKAQNDALQQQQAQVTEQ